MGRMASYRPLLHLHLGRNIKLKATAAFLLRKHLLNNTKLSPVVTVRCINNHPPLYSDNHSNTSKRSENKKRKKFWDTLLNEDGPRKIFSLLNSSHYDNIKQSISKNRQSFLNDAFVQRYIFDSVYRQKLKEQMPFQTDMLDGILNDLIDNSSTTKKTSKNNEETDPNNKSNPKEQSSYGSTINPSQVNIKTSKNPNNIEKSFELNAKRSDDPKSVNKEQTDTSKTQEKDNDDDYEIDLITLRKRRKKNFDSVISPQALDEVDKISPETQSTTPAEPHTPGNGNSKMPDKDFEIHTDDKNTTISDNPSRQNSKVFEDEKKKGISSQLKEENKNIIDSSFDAKTVSNSLLKKYRDSQQELEKLLSYMSDESVLKPRKQEPDSKSSFQRLGKTSKVSPLKTFAKYDKIDNFVDPEHSADSISEELDKDVNMEDLLPSDIRNKYKRPKLANDSNNNSQVETETGNDLTDDDAMSPSIESYNSKDRLSDEDIAHLDEVLGFVRQHEDEHAKERFRLENAFQYSLAVSSPQPRTIQAGNFFTPRKLFNKAHSSSSSDKYVDQFWSPNANSIDDIGIEYAILTPSQKIIRTKFPPFRPQNKGSSRPDGSNESLRPSQDLFSTLSTLKNPEKYAKGIMKLEKQGYTIAGSSGDTGLIVFEREYNKRTRRAWHIIKLCAGFISLLGGLVIILLATIEVPVDIATGKKPKSISSSNDSSSSSS